MKRTLLLLILAGVLVVGAARADDVWVLQGNAQSPIDGGTVLLYLWRSDVLLYNANASSARIRLVEVSNGPLLTTDRELSLEAGRSTSIGRSGKRWFPDNLPPLWVTHLDVPAGVVIESRISVGQECTSFCGFPSPGVFGKLSFPVLRSLQPPLVPKIHLGTDLQAVPARNNVAVYNDAEVTAHATIEVHQSCDESIIDSREVDIPPKSVTQTNGLQGVPNCLAVDHTYVSVTVDQPSLSWVSSLSKNDRIKVVWVATSSSP